MPPTLLFYATFIALGLSICSVWMQPPSKPAVLWPSAWLPLYLVAIVCGLLGGFLTLPAILGIAGLLAAAYYANRVSMRPALSAALFAVVILLSLVLAMHMFPGFKNPILVQDVKFSEASAPFTQYANFDKASVGLILLLFFCPRATSFADFIAALRQTFPRLILIVAAVLGLAWALGFTKFDVKLPGYTLVFLATNLLFTCVAEEAFFRGLLQTRISKAMAKVRYGEALAIACSGLLFGVVHIGGGVTYFALATVAGIGYAYLYSTSKRIEIPILAHFGVNALHFVFFTYPHVG